MQFREKRAALSDNRGNLRPMGRAQPFMGTEAVRCGAQTYRDLRRHTRVYRNVYFPCGTELTAKDRAVAAWLWSDRKAVVAGNSAAALARREVGGCGFGGRIDQPAQASTGADHHEKRNPAAG